METITLQELYEYLNTLLEVADFTDYSPNGLQVEGKIDIRKVAFAVSANLATIQAAVGLGADALIVHHGLFWKGDEYPIIGVKKKKLEILLKNQLSLLAYHLPLDAHPEIGNNGKAAADLGWKDIEPFGYLSGKPIGVVGSFPKMSRADFEKKLEEYYKHPVTAARGGKDFVESACLISGGAYKSVKEAAKAGADCFITGNFDLPAWDDAMELGINFYAIGHTATEKIGPRALKDAVKNRFGIECVFIDDDNPF